MKRHVAIIGCGRIGKRHAEQVALAADLVAVCDVIPAKAAEVAVLYNATAYHTIDALLATEKKLDLVSICTPNGLHAIHAIKSLAAGNNVLCEKPLCISVEDGEAMIDAAENAGRQLFVVKQNRYNPPVEFLKSLIDNNQLGKIFSFQVNCFWNRPTEYYTDWKGKKDLDGGTLFTQFSHFIDLIYWLLGDVKTVAGLAGNFAHPTIDFEDTGVVTFQMTSGAIGTLNYTVNSFDSNMEGSITIFAEKGTIKIGGQYLNELEYCKVENVDMPDLPKGNSANGYGFYKGSMSNHDKVYKNVIKALNDPNHSFATAAEGLKTVEIIERIYESLK